MIWVNAVGCLPRSVFLVEERFTQSAYHHGAERQPDLYRYGAPARVHNYHDVTPGGEDNSVNIGNLDSAVFEGLSDHQN